MAEREPGQPESVDGSVQFERAAGATSFLQRAVIRRRVRFLRRRRELALYDLGGFLFESHRLGQPHEDLLAEKLAALTALDDELALLQRSLDLREEVAVLREPGIAACAYCAAIRDSAANFCPNCGRPAGSQVAEPELDGTAVQAPTAASDDTAVQAPIAASDDTAVQAPIAASQDTAVQAPIAASDDTAVQAPAAIDGSAAVKAVAAAPAPVGGEPSTAAADSPS
ncbi:MAG TPA: hypothetical protein VN740_05025 [Solirubrobacteraceae bacterium]|nr:hypothetical protein [Solirubrobacteraceae bacterium]